MRAARAVGARTKKRAAIAERRRCIGQEEVVKMLREAERKCVCLCDRERERERSRQKLRHTDRQKGRDRQCGRHGGAIGQPSALV